MTVPSIQDKLAELPPVLKPQECQRVLRCGRNQLYELLGNGEIRSVRIGRTYRVTKTALLEFMGEQEDQDNTTD